MSSASPTRPSRRAATRRKALLDDSDEENLPEAIKEEDPEDDFTPGSKQSPRRQTRRKTADVPPTPRTAARTRRTRTGESIVPSILPDGVPDLPPAQVSPTKKSSPRKRKSAAPPKTRPPSATDASNLQLPTPKPSATPEPSALEASPLTDITTAVNNEQIPAAVSQKAFIPVKPMDAVLEKPMDIVIRSRALAAPVQQDDSGPKPRTVIKNLVLTNFKSYAGRQEVGPFHASFSSVVGPNGSGKSNVIDSLLFVFGFRASKMRQGKISALIHNSAAFPDLDNCEVEVHFQEVMDMVSGPGCKRDPKLMLTLSSLVESTKSCQIQLYSYHGRRSKITQANTTSISGSQISPMSQHC